MGRPEVTEYNKEDVKERRRNLALNLTWGKLVLLLSLSLALCSFGPLSIFAPVPLILGTLLYGTAKVSLAFGLGFAGLVGVSQYFQAMPVLLILFAFSYLLSLAIAQVISRQVHPVKGMMLIGWSLVFLVAVGVGVFVTVSEMSIVEVLTQSIQKSLSTVKESQGELLAQGGDEARALVDYLNNPDLLIKEILYWSPAALFVTIFLSVWLNLLLTLRNALIWRPLVSYAYGARELLDYKVPEILIWPFLTAIVLVVGVGHFWGKELEIIGGNALYMLGIFYFFQGLGVTIDFFNYLRIGGFVRSFLMIFLVFVAWKLVAVVGVLDMWFEFKNKMKNKTEGDPS